MNKPTLIALKTLTWIACLYPLAILIYGAVQNNLGPDPTGNIEFSTGLAALRLLVISLAITPLRKLSPRLSFLIKFRRLLGLFAFFYASIHLIAYVGLYRQRRPQHHPPGRSQAPLHHRRRPRLAAPCAARPHIHHRSHQAPRRQALEPTPQARLHRGLPRPPALLVAK